MPKGKGNTATCLSVVESDDMIGAEWRKMNEGNYELGMEWENCGLHIQSL